MRAAGLSFLLPTLAAGCSAQSVHFLEFPEAIDAQQFASLLIAIETLEPPKKILRIEAFDLAELDPEEPIRLPIDQPSALVLLWAYAESLDALGFRAGSVTLADEEGASFPSVFDLGLCAEIGTESAASWSVRTELTDTLGRQRVQQTTSPCDLIAIQTKSFEDPALDLEWVAFVSRDRIAFSGSRAGPVGVLALQSTGAPLEVVDVPKSTTLDRLAYDGRGLLYGSDVGRLLGYDPSGKLQITMETPPIAYAPVFGPDGTGLAYHTDGMYLQLVAGSSVATPVSYGLPTPIHSLAIHSRTRMVAAADHSLMFFDEEMAWREELRLPEERELRQVLIDEQRAVLITDGGAWERDSQGRWTEIPDSFIGSRRGGALLAGDGLLIFGGNGYTAVRTGGVWCRLDTGTARSLRSAAADPEGKLAIVLDDKPSSGEIAVSDGALTVRIELLERL